MGLYQYYWQTFSPDFGELHHLRTERVEHERETWLRELGLDKGSWCININVWRLRSTWHLIV